MSDLLAYGIIGLGAYGIYLYETGQLSSFLVNTAVGTVEEVAELGQEIGSELTIDFIESLGIDLDTCKKGVISAIPMNAFKLFGARAKMKLAEWRCEVARLRSILLDANVGVAELTPNADGSQLIAAYDNHPEYDTMMKPHGFDRIYIGSTGLSVSNGVKFKDLQAPQIEVNLPRTLFWLYDKNPKAYERFRKKGVLPKLPYRRP